MKSIKQLSFVLVSHGFMTATRASDAHPATPSSVHGGVKFVDAILFDTRKLPMY